MSQTDLHADFAPPAADLAVPAPAPPEFPFFLVGTPKLVVLTVMTLGVYQAFWFYMHWRRLKEFGGEDVWPIVRAVFGGLFAYWLFERVNEEADAQGTPTLLSPGVLTILYFVAVATARFEAPIWLTLGMMVLPLALTQSIVNRLPQVQTIPKAQRNASFSKKNWAGAAVFALLVLLAMLPDPGAATTP